MDAYESGNLTVPAGHGTQEEPSALRTSPVLQLLQRPFTAAWAVPHAVTADWQVATSVAY